MIFAFWPMCTNAIHGYSLGCVVSPPLMWTDNTERRAGFFTPHTFWKQKRKFQWFTA